VQVGGDPSRVTAAVVGDLDIATAGRFVDRLGEVVADGAAGELTIDLAEVRFCDSAGIGALIRIRTLSDEHGWQFAVVNPQPAVLRVLDLTGVRDYLNVR
jgi:anti-sigma B factor antagonist